MFSGEYIQEGGVRDVPRGSGDKHKDEGDEEHCPPCASAGTSLDRCRQDVLVPGLGQCEIQGRWGRAPLRVRVRDEQVL